MKPLLILISFLFLSVPGLAKEAQPPRVAMLISGYASEGNPALSYDLEELAQSYLVLSQNGVAIDIISPQGGSVLVKNNKDDLPFIKSFKQSTPALKQLANTLSAEQAKENDYQALFIVGGDGAMFDLPVHAATQQLISGFFQRGLPVAAVCHGPAALINLKMPSGEYVVKGKQLNAFTLREEQAFSSDIIDLLPFMLETELKKRGAIFRSNAPMLPYLVVDGNLITAQNPMSVAMAAEALLLKLDITPVSRDKFRDEATLTLVSRARSQGDFVIDLALASHPDSYDMNYLALYGFYAYRLAETQADKMLELGLMARIGEHFYHPQYQLGLIAAYLEQGYQSEALAVYTQLQERSPETEVPEHLKLSLEKKG